MPLNLISIYKVETPLGMVKCGLKGGHVQCDTTGPFKLENGDCLLTKTENYSFDSMFFKLPINTDHNSCVTASFGWLWRIKKHTQAQESIELFCSLKKKRNEIVEFDTACGEALDAIEAFNNDWTLHIGAEDGETLHQRAVNGDGLPERFKQDLGFHSSFTKLTSFGVKTTVPQLSKGEEFHIHYLMAYGKREANNVETWLAVDLPKRRIENWVGIS
nr:hypothetical protein [uncultured Mucilaginibacter sp.]